MILEVNAEAVRKVSDRLEELGKYALPNAVRNTLNSAAFDTKKRVPITASKHFTTRNKSFFRSFTLVNKAGGNNISAMRSEVGINATRQSKVAAGLEKQEFGGTIKNRNLIAMDQARTGNSADKKVKKANLLQNIKISKTRKKGSGTGFIMIKKGSKGTIFSTQRKKLTPIYSYQSGRGAKVHRTPFMQLSSLDAQRRIPFTYIKEGQKIIKRYTR